MPDPATDVVPLPPPPQGDPDALLEREPVRIPGWLAALLTGLLAAWVTANADGRINGKDLGEMVTVFLLVASGNVGATEFGRAKAYAPSTVRRLVAQVRREG